jgi:methionyl aminopeptidase
VGHGIGKTFHQAPSILHYANSMAGVMKPGIAFTVEPCVNEGGEGMRILADGWTAVTLDGKRSAQCEHTVLITDNVSARVCLGVWVCLCVSVCLGV